MAILLNDDKKMIRTQNAVSFIGAEWALFM